MPSFFIHKLIISGKNKTDSIIEFSDELNIIFGPSNTGKTYIINCIDFLFGSSEDPFDISLGYSKVKLVIKTERGIIELSRELGSNKIIVSSSDSKIKTATYNISGANYEKTINSVWLTLIDIDEKHLIIKNERYEKQTFSWRTFMHMFLLEEERIISKKSVLLPPVVTSHTASNSALLYLLTGNDFGDFNAVDDKKIKEVKKDTIISYINQEISSLADQRKELKETISDYDLATKINEINEEIQTLEKALSEALNANQVAIKGIQDANQRLSECHLLTNRYAELKSQYKADMQRLNFIVDGEVNLKTIHKTTCPICSTEMIINNPNHIAAAKAEYRKIKLQNEDLENTISDLDVEVKTIESELNRLLLDKEKTETIISQDLKPRISDLHKVLEQYNNAMQIQGAIDFIGKYAQKKSTEIIEVNMEDESELKYHPKEHFPSIMVKDISDLVYNMLYNSSYDDLVSAIFDIEKMDVIVNGLEKRSFGKGYRAFLNSIVSTIFIRYLRDKGSYSPNLLLIDSPILSLKEKSGKLVSGSMKNGLFNNWLQGQSGIQTIIIENEIPNIDYGDANIIEFTKKDNVGRYGLLHDVR